MTALLASVVLDRAADQIAKTGLGKGMLWDRDLLSPEVRCCAVGEDAYYTHAELAESMERIARELDMIEDL